MRICTKTFSAGLTLLAGLFGANLFPATPAAARQASASRAGTRPAADVLARIGQAAGVTVVADPTLAQRVPLPGTAATPQNVERQIAEVVKALPAGTTWAKLYLPAPPNNRSWSWDEVAGYVQAQAKLFGAVGPAPAGMAEILGQRVPAEKARDVIASLNLKPVYLVTSVNAHTVAAPSAPGRGGAGDLSQWVQMTPEQQRQYAQQQASQILNMDPAMRQQAVLQQRMIFSQMMRQMTPEQRQQMFDEMGVRAPLPDEGSQGQRRP
jgi:hypothetical protein